MTYPTDPKTGQNVITIPELLARRDAIMKAANGLPDDLYCKVASSAWIIETAILRQPATSQRDIDVKLELWGNLVADPLCIHDIHADLWEQLKEDFWRMECEA